MFLIFAGTIGTHCEHQQIFVIIVVVQTGEVRNTSIAVTVVFYGSTCCVTVLDVPVFVCSIGNVACFTFEHAPLFLTHGVACHGAESVFAPLVIISQGIIPDIVVILVFVLCKLSGG